MARTPGIVRPERQASTFPVQPAARKPRAWHMINITPTERAGRVVVGLAAVVAGAFMLVTAGSVLAIVLEALLIAAGLDLAITGALGQCPLYAKLGYLPRSLSEPR